MSRFHVCLAIAALLALPAAAQPTTCNLTISATCNTTGTNSACTATTVNAGDTGCSGNFISGIWAVGSGMTVSSPTNSFGLTQCFDSSLSPGIPNSYAFCMGDATLAPKASFTSSANVTGNGPIYGVTVVEDRSAPNGLAAYVYAQANAKGATCTPTISSSAASVYTKTPYTISWSPISDPTAQYLLDESTTADFKPGTFTETQSTSPQAFTKSDPGTFWYRVKGTVCAGGTPDYSLTVNVKVTTQDPTKPEANLPAGSTKPVTLSLTIPGKGTDVEFTATTDKPYLTVSPSSGTLPPNGTTLSVTVTPGSLPPGTNTGTLKVTSNGETTNTPIAVSIVTPVQASPKDMPPPNALVIPIVTHVNAAAGPFLSDVRLTNASGQATNYLVTMAPVSSDPSLPPIASESTTISIPPQGTAALNDIVRNFFGFGASGATSDTGFGSLQIRPLDSASALNFAASRTYTTQAIGTFGQFIAAIPFSKFATLATSPIAVPGQTPGRTTTKLSLQQVSTSSRFRTNYGLAEGAGQPASGVVRVFDDNGQLVTSTPFSLNPGQVDQKSLGALAPSLIDGRIEVEITSPAGAVTAYASVVDNGTTDPFAVAPVDVSAVSATSYILPGIAEFTNPTSNFHSDARIFNGGTSDVTAMLSFYPISGLPAAGSKTLTIPAGHIAALDNILPSFFGVSGTGGSVVVTTSSPSTLVATANTYSNSPKGTFGQFIPGVTGNDGIAAGDRPLQILQLEQSDQFRSNLGLAELTGHPVTVEVSLYQPDSKETPFIDVDLAPYEFKQLNSVIANFFGQTGQTYNARVTVSVKSGSGRVAGYGSVIDKQSSDPTYVPAQ